MEEKLTPVENQELLNRARKISHQAADLLRDALEKNADFSEDLVPLNVLSINDILTTEWPEPVWAIPNILPVGLTILAGRPKVGKSWLALQIALSVASGGHALGENVEKGPILYLALEDPPRRLKERTLMQGWTSDLAADFMKMGDFETQIDDLRNGGGERLARQIETKGYRYVVIDTLSRSTMGDQNDVAEMTLALAPIQAIAHAQNCAVVMVDHHRKMSLAGPNAVTDILGSTAKGAMADSIWGLYKEHGKIGAKLAITGRDIEEKTLALTFDGHLGCWQSEGDVDEAKLTERQHEILDALGAMGESSLSEIAAAVDGDTSNVYRSLSDLVNTNQVRKTGKQKKARYDLQERVQ